MYSFMHPINTSCNFFEGQTLLDKENSINTKTIITLKKLLVK